MANLIADQAYEDETGPLLKISEFEIDGLFGGGLIHVKFPSQDTGSIDPSILILSGRNGTGKTTILRMIGGMLKLNFDPFRGLPFSWARLTLSNGDQLMARPHDEPDYSLWMEYNGAGVKLPTEKGDRDGEEHNEAIDRVRSVALPNLNTISYQFLDLDRIPTANRLTRQELMILRQYSAENERRTDPTISKRVASFVKDAQINFHRFFREEELGYLPRLLDRLKPDITPATPSSLLERLKLIRKRYSEIKHFGLSFDEEQLKTLEGIIDSSLYDGVQQLAIIETHVENHENAQRARDLIAQRLLNFERIMADFLIGKTVKIVPNRGIEIHSATGRLKEQQLSSGEYHFLYMMVAALLCQRVGTIIAIDEPELSLHVSWQRKLVSALMDCASGASPMLLFATHSLVIAAEHRDAVQTLSAVD